MSDCHSPAALLTRTVAPVVSDARKVMMATTATSARPEIELRGTSGVSKRGSESAGIRSGVENFPWPVVVIRSSIVDVQPAVMQHQPPRIVLIHKRDVVGRNDDRGPRLVELNEQSQKPLRQSWIDVSGGLVREQELRSRDHRACN